MSQGPNAGLIGAWDAQARLATPSLLLDADAFEHNLAAMMDLARRYRRQVRPHVKAHKCTAIARRQLEAGAVGLCCATVREAEVMAEAGLDGHSRHLAGDRAGHGRAARLGAGPRRRPRCGGRRRGRGRGPGRERERRSPARCGGRDRRRAGPDRRDGSRRRSPPRPPNQGLPQLRYRGVQAYYGHLQHVPGYVDRKAKAAEQWARLQTFLDALGAAGLRPEIVTGGGTGTCIARPRGRAVHRDPAGLVPVHGQAV